jgi:hypothetical protein
MSSPVSRFMRQQGFAEEPPASCELHFAGLLFQPRLVFPLVLLAIAAQLSSARLSVALHLAISLVLCWNALVPSRNPFELAYNRWRAGDVRVPLHAAPAPRRFAQGMAAAFNLGAGLALLLGARPLAWLLQGLLVVAFSALLFGRFCLGAYVYHLLRGRVAFANETLPWARRSGLPLEEAHHADGPR